MSLLVAVCVTACAGARSLVPGLAEPSPRERYADRLASAGLDAAALTQDWLRAGERALVAAHDATLPLRETGYIDAARPTAVAYRLSLPRGRVLLVDVAFETTVSGRLFVDLFWQPPDEAQPSLVASLQDDETTLRVEVDRDGTYLLRLQPELLRGGRYTVVNRTEALLRTFPVDGMTPRAVWSGFGAPRDGGSRGHEGVDIFAPRGTPVLAVVDGIASPSTNNLGGIVVWLRDRRARRTFYYAHLDRVADEAHGPVVAGAVLGYVGNTGNARTTAPHLHFGIYSPRPIDPSPFVAADDATPVPVGAPAEVLGAWARTARASVPLRAGPAVSAPRLATLERDAVMRVEAASLQSYRVSLPDGTTGYVAARDLLAADGAERRTRLATTTDVRDAPNGGAPIIAAVDGGTNVSELGRFGTFRMIRLEDGATGWIADGR